MVPRCLKISHIVSRVYSVNDLLAKAIAWLGIFVFLISLSCAHERKATVVDDAVKGIGKLDEKEALDVSLAINHARLYLAAEDFQKSLETMQRAYAEYPDNSTLGTNYIEVLKQIKSYADSAIEEGRFAMAGYAYSILLKNYAHYSAFEDLLLFNKGLLTSGIKMCSKALYKNGLAKYREENLDEAILIWKKILAFDYENREARKAISTAKIQLKTLERLQK